MVINAFQNRIIPLAYGSYSEYLEERDSDWIKNPEKFIDLKEELAILNDNFSASFNLNIRPKNINVSEMKRFVDDVEKMKKFNKKVFKIYLSR